MGLDIGIISIRYLERPQGRAYEFAWELAEEASVHGYMHGEGNSWGAFSKEQVRSMLDDFAGHHHLSQDAKAQVWAWAESLPWDGEDIELHFNW
ncbi:MAG: hypothetical protein ACE5I2_14845 [Anaerolineae bacterium]